MADCTAMAVVNERLSACVHGDGRCDEHGHVETGWLQWSARCGVPRVVAAAPAGGLLVGDPDAVARAGLRGLKGEVVGGGDGGEVGQMASEFSVGDGLLHCAEVEGLCRHERSVQRRSAVILMLRSTAVAEWVSAPTEMKSTPVLA